MKRLLFILLMLIGFSFGQTENVVGDVYSPDENLKAEVILNKTSGDIFYQVKLNENTVLEKSKLGLQMDDFNLVSDMTFKSMSKTRKISDSYKLISGKQLKIESVSNQCDFNFANQNGINLTVRFRLFNDGLGFRYLISDNSEGEKHKIIFENTSFNLLDDGNAWMHPYDDVSKWTPGYETYYQNGIEIGTPAPVELRGWAFPLLFEVDDSWALITEAGDFRDYCGTHLYSECEGGEYRIKLPEPDEAYNLCSHTPTIETPWQSPWRVIILAHSLAEIVESNLVTNLAEENSVQNPSWIKPGKSSWSWWSKSESPRDFEALKEFVDFSAKMGWKYSLVDANWNKMENGNLKKLTEYANKKDVGLLVWYNSGGSHNTVPELPRDRINTEEERQKEFAWLNKIGVKGIKVDFFQSDKQCIINLYEDILRDAAEYELVVNFHGCTLPKGWRRKYPNLLTMESVKGAECYKFDKNFSASAPILNAIYPFTRNVVGPMDYTPLTFSHNVLPHFTSFGHELALSVVFESGIGHFADHYEAYLSQPDYVQSFLEEVPVIWEKTRLISGYPGKDAVLARKKDDSWYVGGINGEFEDKSFEFEADFLESGEYTVELITDGAENDEYQYQELKIRKGHNFKVDVLRYGGFVMIIKPE